MEPDSRAQNGGPFPTHKEIKKSISNAYIRLVAADIEFGNDGKSKTDVANSCEKSSNLREFT